MKKGLKKFGILCAIVVMAAGLISCTGKKPSEKGSNDLEGTNISQWTRAMGAVLMEKNQMDPYYFGGMEVSEESRKKAQTLLKDSWEIDTRDSLLIKVDSLVYEGDRARYWKEVLYLEEMTEEDLAAFRESAGESYEIYLNETIRNKEVWGERGLLAWDLSRIATLVQWGYVAEYITKEEANALMEPVAVGIQGNFTTWDEFQTNYMDGFAWSAEIDIEADKNEYTERLNIYEKLKADQKAESPLFDETLFTTAVIPVEDLSYGDLLDEY